jgi:hydrogenase maturation protein HypF
MHAAKLQLEMPPQSSGYRFVLRGRVQGLGIRPAIVRLALQLDLSGTVRNTAEGVEAVAEGTEASLSAFHERLRDSLPPAAVVEALEAERIAPQGCENFTIVRDASTGPLSVRVPPDRRVCPDCLRETLDSGDRRFRYPLTSCTLCGPRYTIIRAMPYERPDTSMSSFDFCSRCEGEYGASQSRRFHAQTNACEKCGPQVWAVDDRGRCCGTGEAAMQRAVAALRKGKIVAIKGIGGYQLLADATNADAVRRLRARKGRPTKPLAVMVATVSAANELAYIDNAAAATLQSSANPIVLLPGKPDGSPSPEIHGHLNTIGILLPSTPLHGLIAHDFGRALVCTSGNADGEPLVYCEQEAETALNGIADLWLHHDRPIERPIDDSVVRMIAGRSVTIRLARGLAPLPLDAPLKISVVALGGHMKSAAAWSNGRQSVLGPHVGDLDTLAARERYLAQLESLQSLYRFVPRALVHDLHPDYFTTRWAEEGELRRISVQHHHAHVVASMIEHGWLDREVLGVAWDGTGYAPDGTIWGGEFLVCTTSEFKRFAMLRPFRLPGGERCIHEPWRTGLSVIVEAVGLEEARRRMLFSGSVVKADLIMPILTHTHLCLATTSAGRLFDAAAHIILGVNHVNYEGEAAMMLEAAADASADGSYDFPLSRSPVCELDWRPLVAGLVLDRNAGVSPGVLAMRFHRTLANGIATVCRLRPDLPVVLAGGVFQNRLLTELVVQSLDGHSQSLGLPGLIPPNDGGLAAGQLAIAASRLESP